MQAALCRHDGCTFSADGGTPGEPLQPAVEQKVERAPVGIRLLAALCESLGEAVQAGKALFTSAGCAACHTPSYITSAYHPKAELRNQVIHPFTDLLLHDMGPGLADNLPEGMATGAEWRTAPLWNIGFTAGASGGEGYLHDGRARTLKEAVLWHGGEAQGATDKFKALAADDQDALIKFLKSL